MPAAAGPQVVQVELEDVVPLDDVGIERRQLRVELQQQPLLRRVGHLLEQEEAGSRPPERIPMASTRSSGFAASLKPPVRRARLDVHLAAPQPGKAMSP